MQIINHRTLIYDIEDLNHNYPLGTQTVVALKAINLQIFSGDFICLSGPSGSGKSTLLNILGLIEPPQQGRVNFLNQSVSALSEAQKNAIRKYQLGFVFQDYQLLSVLSVKENIDYFLNKQKLSKVEQQTRSKQALHAVDLWSQRHKKPEQLSGGQRQRVAIARAIAKQPKLIIADEPTANLDQQTAMKIMNIFIRLNTEQQVTIIISSHDPMVIGMVKQQVVLADGGIGKQVPNKAQLAVKGGTYADVRTRS